ncbi:MAG: caspase family protein [Desulfobacterales bacterium]|nr:caspase family protein [Desulfobacterales bacterium]
MGNGTHMGRMGIRQLILVVLATAVLCMYASVAPAETRTALVIGNGDYLKNPLNNPVNDAKDMAVVLGDLGFQVILGTNRDKAGMQSAVDQFGRRLKQGGVGLFFYAGHGIQVDGVNYMVPVGARVARVGDIKPQCLEIASVLSAMQAAKNDLNIVILDACRNNPFESVTGVSKGLALMDAPKGSYIAFSTRPGALSGDGIARNGLYTSRLLKHIRTPGLSLVDLFMTVRNDVIAASNDTQEPWDNHALRRHFYFVPDGTESSPPYAAGAVVSIEEESVPDVEDEPDAPEGYRKEVVVEYHNGEPVEVVYYVPIDDTIDDDTIVYEEAEDEPDVIYYYPYDDADEEPPPVVLTYPDNPSPRPPVVAQRRIEPETRPRPRPRYQGPVRYEPSVRRRPPGGKPGGGRRR